MAELKKNISVRLRDDNVAEFYALREYLSSTNPLLSDLNNNQLVNYCINFTIDHYEEKIKQYQEQLKKTDNK